MNAFSSTGRTIPLDKKQPKGEVIKFQAKAPGTITNIEYSATKSPMVDMKYPSNEFIAKEKIEE